MKSQSLADTREQRVSIARIMLIAAFSAAVGGVIAILMVFLMLWLCNRSWVVDEADSHGISETQSSRLGGIAVFFGAIAFFAFSKSAAGGFGVLQEMLLSPSDYFGGYSHFVFLIALVGLWDDLVKRFSPIVRLVLVLAISSVALATDAVLILPKAYEWLPFGLNNTLFLMAAGTLIVTGFVNAGNMADGANGLLAIVGVSFFIILMLSSSAQFAAFFILALLVFLVFNVSTGRIFLGDFGAYGLSATIAFGSLELYSSGMISIWFLGSLLAYPCIEMVRVIVVRSLQGSSPFQASNDHLHNYLYEALRKRGWNPIVANSSAGCFLGAISAGLPVSILFAGVTEAGNTHFWGWYFLMYIVMHLGFVIKMKRALHAR